MDQLFKALPQDLQWEILSEFVGTHKVRNGKLLRKITGEHQVLSLKTALPMNLWLKDRRFHLMYNNKNSRCTLGDLKVLTILMPKLNNLDRAVYLCEAKSGELIYIYNTPTSRFEIPLDNSVILCPFVKHIYPSYPHTNKKKRTISKILAMNKMYNKI
jgi:hypothetical protein